MSRRNSSLALLALLLIVLVLWQGPGIFAPGTQPGAADSTGERAVLDAFRARQSGVTVEAAGNVSRLLPDDGEGSRHQRLIVRLPSGHTVLIAHNIDLAPRVPAQAGDRIEFRGEYEWNEQGGVVHWTHHDPGRRRPGGWIRHAGRTFE